MHKLYINISKYDLNKEVVSFYNFVLLKIGYFK